MKNEKTKKLKNEKTKKKKYKYFIIKGEVPEQLKIDFGLICSALGIKESDVVNDLVGGFCSQKQFQGLLKAAKKMKEKVKKK